MGSIWRVLRALVMAPIFWCCSATPHPAPPKALPPEGIPHAATVALENDEGDIYCAGVWVSASHVLTANHCTAGMSDNSAYVEDADGHKLVMTLQAQDPRSDLALLVLPLAPPHVSAPLATSWRIGERLTIVGHPAGVPWVVMHGWIAHEQVHSAPNNGGNMTMLWVQAPIWYGNSGGGAFDDQGNLVGICSMRNNTIPDQAWFVSPEEIALFLASN